MISSVVVLPAPFGPSMPKNSPCADLEADAIDGRDIAIGLAQVTDRDGGWHKAQP